MIRIKEEKIKDIQVLIKKNAINVVEDPIEEPDKSKIYEEYDRFIAYLKEKYN